MKALSFILLIYFMLPLRMAEAQSIIPIEKKTMAYGLTFSLDLPHQISNGLYSENSYFFGSPYFHGLSWNLGINMIRSLKPISTAIQYGLQFSDRVSSGYQSYQDLGYSEEVIHDYSINIPVRLVSTVGERKIRFVSGWGMSVNYLLNSSRQYFSYSSSTNKTSSSYYSYSKMNDLKYNFGLSFELSAGIRYHFTNLCFIDTKLGFTYFRDQIFYYHYPLQSYSVGLKFGLFRMF